jgi:hypothetical protein
MSWECAVKMAIAGISGAGITAIVGLAYMNRKDREENKDKKDTRSNAHNDKIDKEHKEYTKIYADISIKLHNNETCNIADFVSLTNAGNSYYGALKALCQSINDGRISDLSTEETWKSKITKTIENGLIIEYYNTSNEILNKIPGGEILGRRMQYEEEEWKPIHTSYEKLKSNGK